MGAGYAGAMGFAPGGAVRGSLRVPGSKSIAQRALVCAGLASGTTRIAGLPEGEDVAAARRLVEACGARVAMLAPSAVSVTGKPPGPHRGWSPAEAVSAGESGTLARMATAVLALAGEAGKRHEVRGEGTLRRRRSPALFAALERAGVEVEFLGGRGGWPARVKAIGPPSDVAIEDPGSSQEVSALLVALAAWPDEIRLGVQGAIPSRGYVDLTRSVLARFGGRVDEEVGRPGGRGERCFRALGPLVAPADPIVVEPDASSAAVALAAGCISGGRVEVPGLAPDSAQPDARGTAMFERFGCGIGAGEAGTWAEGAPSRGAEVDCAESPDLAPVVAVLAAVAALGGGGLSRIGGLATLAGKESSRIAVLERGLTAVGLEAQAGADALVIGPASGRAAAGERVLDPEGDHRMAFAFALLGLAVEGVRVADPGCVAKSWPDFWADLEQLGARVVRQG